MDRIARELRPASGIARAGVIPQPKPPRLLSRILPALGWIASGAVAALLVVLAVRAPGNADTILKISPGSHESAPVETGASAAETASDLGEVATSRQLVNATEEELLVNDDQEPTRRMRFTFIERHTWTDPETGSTVEVEIPREDVVLVPVAMQ